MERERRNIPMECEDEQKPQRVFDGVAFDIKNYLNVKLDDTQVEKKIRFRLLPFDNKATSPFKITHMHNIRVPKEISASGWKSYVCLSKAEDIDHEKFGSKCPFCEERSIAYDKMVEAKKNKNDEEAKKWREISCANIPGEVVIVRGIERGAEEDGPKFWKFNVRSDFEDPMNKIKELQKLRRNESIEIAKEENGGVLPEGFIPDNILDLYEGKDLEITIKAVFDKEGKRTKKTSIVITDFGRKKPVTDDYDLLDKWIDDEKKWFDVFVPKPYDYCRLLIDGEIPFFDKANGKWISKLKKSEDANEKENKKTEEENNVNEKINQAVEKAVQTETKVNTVIQAESEETEELPF